MAYSRFVVGTLGMGALVIACGGAASTELFGTAGTGDSGPGTTSGGDGGGTLTDASTSTDSSSGALPDAGPACSPSDRSSCKSDEYCRVTSCGLTSGVCTKRPNNESAGYEPVCGCDHLTYWNASLAAKNGVSVDANGECGLSATACSSSESCSGGARCSYNVTRQQACIVAGNVSGKCWVLPSDCPKEPQVRSCSDNDCRSRCESIRSEATYFGASLCN